MINRDRNGALRETGITSKMYTLAPTDICIVQEGMLRIVRPGVGTELSPYYRLECSVCVRGLASVWACVCVHACETGCMAVFFSRLQTVERCASSGWVDAGSCQAAVF